MISQKAPMFISVINMEGGGRKIGIARIFAILKGKTKSSGVTPAPW
jgi:hypothetical protein